MAMIIRILIAFLIKLFIDLPMMLLGYVIVPYGLKYGFTGIFWPWGNDDHPDNGGTFWKKQCVGSLWCAYQWFALRNPTFNWSKYFLGFKSEGKALFIDGTSRKIGDTKAEGWYYARERWAWEVYYIKAYSIFGYRKCFRFRCGWKIMGRNSGEYAQFCFVISPIHSYSGV